MVNDSEDQDLKAWPSDYFGREKFNIVEFYHKILWASQQPLQQQQQQYQHYEDHSEVIQKRVTFSVEPPEIYEYEPEYSTETTATTTAHIFADYFRRKFHHSGNEDYVPIENQQPPMPLDEDCFKEKTVVRVRSLTEFNPVPNQFYQNQELQQQVPSYHESMQIFDTSFMQIDMSFEMEQQEDMYTLSFPSPVVIDEPNIPSLPPSYDEECIIKRKKSLTKGLKKKVSMNFWQSNSANSDSSTSSTGLKKALRRIKSSPKL
ncbi:hypothetical protein [Parasitella parasitica]|uniref:Uncharacterized protein n=1 Tax=Parasitella parasitica TaxID=35722 RepID=A0A0B7NL58_9FUNG|nr:hypothetical protein [Parasitella parasitica]